MTAPRPGGRRAAAKPSRRLSGPGHSPLALVVLVLAAVLVLVTPDEPGAAPRATASSGAPVTETILGCPRRLVSPAGVDTSYGVALAAVDGAGASGTLQPPLDVTRGEATTVDGDSESGLDLVGLDGFAQGLLGWRADTGSSTALVGCLPPRASWWFTGVGAALDHESTLVVANLDRSPAVVDLSAFSPDGEVDLSATGGSGITVAPGEHTTIPLVELAPQNDELSVWVHASRGRVVAAVTDRYAETPTAARGFEWLPAQVEPSRLLRLSGVPPRARSRTLLVANPSDSESVLTLEVAGPSGLFEPTDLGSLSVDPGALLSVDLSDVLPGEAYAVRVSGTAPVVGTLRSLARNGDVAYAGGVEPLSGPAALPVVRDTSLQLTAGNLTARATVTAYDEGGDVVDSARLSLAPHATTAWTVTGGAAYLVVDPTQGAPFGSVVYEGASAVPLLELSLTVEIPAVRPAN